MQLNCGMLAILTILEVFMDMEEMRPLWVALNYEPHAVFRPHAVHFMHQDAIPCIVSLADYCTACLQSGGALVRAP
jgi:hypothetical protein